ncbi:hypothetical protein A3A09_01370 [Candidatus Nomurabacteria bacterium RIFCSPLOWO2_01_FULL_42_20]|uniref:Uncharacterized protein n=1 Tax=Candidatus Nomurabacteria bacterium RIFCSPHIGHO2_01_FULL_42_16 TaxID=1801743 RepID=A0A1F6VHJ4_9BACT|nr:MAG: hypothetical protein A2824_00495 [Candidatus Nomurabacteria bacterium RIFCSPHIGHO2_01_FULL_42_16]OGI92386.1 MAG: hypothetical protein A3A09_01370 [Candidatus Nomurabacteria bacterium RIFCSPLOWO2_01_FULL_42_20]
MKFFGQKALALFLAISFILPSFLLLPAKKAQAQVVGADAQFGAIIGAGVSIVADCLNIGDKIKNFIEDKAEDLGLTLVESLVGSTAVPTNEIGKTRDYIQTLKDKESCFDAIAYNTIKLALRLTTQELLGWINSGFDGYPFYRDSGSYFTELWENEVNSFSTSLMNLDETLYPWAKATAARILLAHQAKFEDYSRHSLHNFVVGGVDGYRASFSAGGWNAWEAMLLPQNNPIGYSMLAEQELARRGGGGTAFSIRPEDRPPSLASRVDDATNGFFSDRRCTYPYSIEVVNANTDEVEVYVVKGKTEGDLRKAENQGLYIPLGACTTWETVTPGTAIASSLDLSLGTKIKQQELADEMNESIAAIFDALTSQLVTQGVSALTKPCGALDPNYPNDNYQNPKDDPNCQ